MMSYPANVFQGLMARVGGPRLSAWDYKGKTIITPFHSDVGIPLIDPEAWTSGRQTNLGVGEKYDPSKPFLPQLFALCRTAARPWHMHDPRSQDSPWASYDLSMHEAYGTYAGAVCSRVSYCDFCIECENCADCLGCIRLQNSVECVQCVDSDRLRVCNRCEDSFELIACRDCRDCHDCVGCVGLQHASYYWFNEQLTEGEYKLRINELMRARSEEVMELIQQFVEHSKRFPVSSGRQFETQTSIGDDLAFTNRVSGVSLASCVDIRSSAGVALAERGDCLLFCQKIEDSQASIFCVDCSHVRASVCMEACSRIFMGELLIDCHNCIGCVGLRHTSYAILNHVYEKEEYFQLARKIYEEVRPLLSVPERWSELVPVECTPFAYDRSLAGTFFSREINVETVSLPPPTIHEQKLYSDVGWPMPTDHPSIRRRKRYALWGSLQLEPVTCMQCQVMTYARHRSGTERVLCATCFEYALLKGDIFRI
jgi:hypothetical protein